MKIFESDLAEAIYEVIANTSFREDGEQTLREIRVDESDYNFELDKKSSKIRIYNDTDEFQITIHKTHSRLKQK